MSSSINVQVPAFLPRSEKVKKLRKILNNGECTKMPCVFDGHSAKLVEAAGFEVTLMTGFGVSAVNGFPDTNLLSMTEMSHHASMIASVLKTTPCIGDGDTGYGNSCNLKRTVQKYIQMGMAGIMLEDQVQPKRCGHTQGKQVCSREEAYSRILAAVDAVKESGEDFVILARTDARGTHSLDEAILRCKKFRELGADWTFLEAPQSIEEMERYCKEVDGPKMANMLEFGLTPILPPAKLQEMGYSIACYPLTLLSVATKAMKDALQMLKDEKEFEVSQNKERDTANILPFIELQADVGFPAYNSEADRYKFK